MVLEGSFEYVNLWRYGVHVHNLKINIPEEKAKCRVLYIKYECKVTIVRNLESEVRSSVESLCLHISNRNLFP